MSVPVHSDSGLRVGRVDQAKDLALGLIEPVSKVRHVVLSALFEVFFVGLSDSLRRGARQIMNIHEQWHFVVSLNDCFYFRESLDSRRHPQQVSLRSCVAGYLEFGGLLVC